MCYEDFDVLIYNFSFRGNLKKTLVDIIQIGGGEHCMAFGQMEGKNTGDRLTITFFKVE